MTKTTSRGSGSILQRSPDSLTIIVDDRPDPMTRKRRRRWITIRRLPGETDRQLWKRTEKERAKLLVKRDEGEADLVPTRLTVAEYLDRWLDDYARPKLGERTVMSYETTLRLHVIPQVGHLQLTALKPLHVQAIYASMRAKGLSGTTCLHTHRVLREALKWAVRWELAPRNPADSVDAPRSTTKPARTSSLEELARLLKAADETPLGVLVRLAVHTGMRLGEVLGLRWQDVDLENQCLRIELTFGADGRFRKPKTESSRRTISLDDEIAEDLAAHRRAQLEHRLSLGPDYEDNDLVFADPLGRPRSQHSVDRAWNHIRKVAGVPDMRIHDLRHAMASVALSEGINIAVVSKRLGHANVSTTLDIYRHVMPGEDKEAARTLARVLSGR
jgi:integrase